MRAARGARPGLHRAPRTSPDGIPAVPVYVPDCDCHHRRLYAPAMVRADFTAGLEGEAMGAFLRLRETATHFVIHVGGRHLAAVLPRPGPARGRARCPGGCVDTTDTDGVEYCDRCGWFVGRGPGSP